MVGAIYGGTKQSDDFESSIAAMLFTYQILLDSSSPRTEKIK
jgi:hypothetical protein